MRFIRDMHPIEHNILLDSRLEILRDTGIRKDGRTKQLLKKIFWPAVSWRNFLLVDGFIARQVGRMMNGLISKDTVFLDVGCGDMRISSYIPSNINYNAFDISLSEFHIKRMRQRNRNMTLMICSATDMPFESNSVDIIVSMEVLEHIADIDRAVKEMLRVLKPEGRLIVSIPNNYCYKYKRKGDHPEHVNKWTYDGFESYMQTSGFACLQKNMMGLWLPLPLWITKTSYQLPSKTSIEFYNTNFFYLLQKNNSKVMQYFTA